MDEIQQTESTEPKQAARQPKGKNDSVVIHISKERGEAGDVFVGVNGVSYLIKRGVDVTVPRAVLSVLENAVQVEYDPETLDPREVPSYPYSVKG
ncbi:MULTISPECIES: hypothetical protein [Microvirgula]|uniref:hypothetical protein n=1 Tax=Microvirgula TaxID=57479 RepID=UPI0005679126|nr:MULTISPECIES: hypothetical protein [Microvirgula]RAS14829.1 hypothetical protein DFO50_10984 [Microvirgula sp. AG722]